ncbi:HNH endonuclease signature motif containing protein [Paraburkholderia unamae]|uniref:HNH endonuclease signature motif containing protein n=1 Tax=Paraburkholderia unamae TaxID=219649 RepID=A0ACC6RGS0_9BURK
MKDSPQKKNYDTKYESSPEQIKNREERNKARYDAERDGKVKKGDGKDVDHKKPLANGGSNSASNQREVTEKTNRGWRKGQSGYDPSKQKK